MIDQFFLGIINSTETIYILKETYQDVIRNSLKFQLFTSTNSMGISVSALTEITI